MYSTPVMIKTVRGDGDMVGMISALEKVSQPTVGDCLYAGQRQRSRILDRTSKGLDFDARPFHPYSTIGPYYFYPGKTAGNRGAAAARFAKKIGLSSDVTNKKGVTKNRVLKVGAGQVRGKNSASRTRLGIKFSSYAAFKTFLGRTAVDLFGPWAPHMLQAILVKVGGISVAEGSLEDVASTAPANEIIIGIYGEEAERASGHNEGSGHLPQRKFIGASESDKTNVLNDILTRVANRARRVLGGKA